MEKIEMNKELLKGEDYAKDYKELCKVLLSTIGIDQPSKIDQRGNILNLVAVFDSETSNYTVNGEKRPYIISEAMTFLNINNNKNVNVLFRHINPFLKFLVTFSKYLGLEVNYKPLVDKYGNPVTDDFGNTLYDTRDDVYLNVYVHNLPFDASFLLPRLDVFQLFAGNLHKPYYFITDSGFRFVDTAVLTQNSLNGLGQKLRRFDTRKMVGDFNYDIIRTPDTPFTKKEEGYVLNDVLTLSAYITEYVQDNYSSNLNLLPLTQTGIVRGFLRKASEGDWLTYLELYKAHIVTKPQLVKAFTKYLSDPKAIIPRRWLNYHGSWSLTKAVNYLFKSFSSHSFLPDTCKPGPKDPNNQKMLTYLLIKFSGSITPKLTLEQYKLLKEAYQGGYTHSNAVHTNHLLRNVHSFDFTSSYPTRILSQYFADASKAPRTLTHKELDNLQILMKASYDSNKLLKNLYVFKVEADAIRLRNVPDAYLSDYHTAGVNKQLVNGRVINADNVSFTTTSIDWEIISQCYDFTGLKFTYGIVFSQCYLPRYIVASTVHFYAAKTKLKHVKGKEADYMRSKQMLNSIYGCMVSDLTRPNIKYDTDKREWSKFDYFADLSADKNQEIARDEIKKAFLYYVWGVEVSAYARVALWRGILGVGDDYVYSDTDSLKLLNWKKHLPLISKENQLITTQINNCLSYYGINPKLAEPKDIKGIKHPLGVWDPDDGDYKYFKTLGAKRYIDIDDSRNFEITIAGLSKSSGKQFMLKASKCHYKGDKVDLSPDNVKKLFKFFNNNMYVPATATGKLASFYVDKYNSFKVNGVTIPAGGGCLLKPVDFTMSMAVSFEFILDMIAKGYRFGGRFNL